MADFLYTMRFRFSALDDLEARQKVRAIEQDATRVLDRDGAEQKLQRLERGSEPKKVRL